MITLNVSGDAALARHLERIPAGLRGPVLAQGMRDGAEILTDEVKRSAPVWRGNLRAGVRVEVKPKQGGMPVFAVNLHGQNHGMFQEFGTSRQPARPFMRPALARMRGRIVAEAARSVKKIVEGGYRP